MPSPSSAHRPLSLRARPDVVAAAVRVAGSPRWVVTDPVTLANFDLSEQEYTLLTGLKEGASLRDLQRRFEGRFAPRRISLEEVWEFVSRAHREGLAVSAAGGQGETLGERGDRRRREDILWSWTRLLAIRLPGFNPDPALDVLYPMLRWVFSRPFLALVALVALYAGAIVLADFSVFAATLPSVAQLTAPHNLAALLVTAAAVKVLHELGHALACRHFGGRVHEMGVLLLAFTPALYCDVSDMWRLPSKARRMAVSAAGICVELALAAIATIVWRYAQPGVVQLAAIDVMIVCTVGTLLVNGNPLLRYDGYYLLSDLTETPNLWQRSRDALRSIATDWLARRDEPRRPIRPWWLPLYGLASQAYVVFVLVSIVWLLAVALRPYRLEGVAWVVGLAALGSFFAPPARRLVQWLRNPAATRRVRGGRALAAAALVLVALALLWRTPWGYPVEGTASVAVADAERIVTTVAGRLAEAAAPGDVVRRGDVVARLENPDVRRELLEVEGQLAEQRLRVRSLRALRARDRQANTQLPAAEAMVEDLSRRHSELRRESERLVLRARRDGVVIAPPAEPPPRDTEARLPQWSGSPLDNSNRGAWITPGALVCLVGDPERVRADLLLTEDDIERVDVGQPLALAWRQRPGVVTRGRVVEVSRRAHRQQQQEAHAPPAETLYHARAEMDGPETARLVGGEGRVKIDTGRATLGAWAVARLRQLFRLP